MEIKYVYFEVHYIVGDKIEEPTLKNENVLLFKPHTNSVGQWGFRNITKIIMRDNKSYLTVDQHWIDLDKYVPYETYRDINTDIFLQECLVKLKEKNNDRY